MTVAERNRAIADAYRGGALQSAIAREFGLSKSTVSRIIAKQGAGLSRDELNRMSADRARKATSDPAIRAKIAEGVRAAWARGCPLGRKAILAADPVQRADYLNLREAYGADYAREVMRIAA